MNLQPGKLYRVSRKYASMEWGHSYVTVYKECVPVGGSLSQAWHPIEAGALIMWLGEQGCETGWAKVLHGTQVYYVYLSDPNDNLKMLERVGLP